MPASPLARAVSQGLRLSRAPDGYKLQVLANLFHHVDDAINKRSRLQALVEFWAQDGQVLVIRDSRDCDGTCARYKHLMPANWHLVRDYMQECLADAEGPQSFTIRSPNRYEVY